MRIAEISGTELIAGSAAIAIGVAALALSSEYEFGSLQEMGMGFFPLSLAVLMIACGIGIILFEGRREIPSLPAMPAFRPILTIMAGILGFALLIEPFGLVAATMAAAFLSSFADPKVRPLHSLLLAAAVAVCAVLIFDVGLGLQMRAFR